MTAGQLPCYSFYGKDKLKERGERRAVVVVSRTESAGPAGWLAACLPACLPLGETIHTKLLEGGEEGGGEEEEERMLNYYFPIEDFSKSGPLKEKKRVAAAIHFHKMRADRAAVRQENATDDDCSSSGGGQFVF